MNFRTTTRRRADVLLDLTPLIDVVFLLLIFFLITSTFVRHREMVVTINLPEGAAQAMPAEEEELTIYVDAVGRYAVTTDPEQTGRMLDYQALETELRTLYDTKPELSIYLRGDRDVNYGAVIDVLLLSREIGFQRVQAVIRDTRPRLPTPSGP